MLGGTSLHHFWLPFRLQSFLCVPLAHRKISSCDHLAEVMDESSVRQRYGLKIPAVTASNLEALLANTCVHATMFT